MTPAGLQAAGSPGGEQQLLLTSGALLNNITPLYEHHVQWAEKMVHVHANVFTVTR